MNLTKQSISEKVTDKELVLLSIANPDYFGFIIDRYESKLDRYMKSISGANPDQRLDLLQDVFLSVYQNLHAYNPKIKFSSWVYRIAHNKTISWWRKHKKEVGSISIDEHLPFVESIFHEEPIKEMYEEEHIRLASEYALERMKDSYREILLLKYWEDKSYEEIADITEASTGTVGTRVVRAKKQFSILFKEYEQT